MAPDELAIDRRKLVYILHRECARETWRPRITDPCEAPCFVPDALMVRVAGEFFAGRYSVEEALGGVA